MLQTAQIDIVFAECEPCKHCGGTAKESVLIAKEFNKSTYAAYVFECDTCTFETAHNVGNRDKAVEYWNKGVQEEIAGKDFAENWEFITRFCGQEIPRLKVQPTDVK